MLFTLGNRIEPETPFQPGRALHIYIVTELPTEEGRDKQMFLVGFIRIRTGDQPYNECSTNLATFSSLKAYIPAS